MKSRFRLALAGLAAAAALEPLVVDLPSVARRNDQPRGFIHDQPGSHTAATRLNAKLSEWPSCDRSAFVIGAANGAQAPNRDFTRIHPNGHRQTPAQPRGLRPFSTLCLSSPQWVAFGQSVDNSRGFYPNGAGGSTAVSTDLPEHATCAPSAVLVPWNHCDVDDVFDVHPTQRPAVQVDQCLAVLG
jgi:hypothetical protein